MNAGLTDVIVRKYDRDGFELWTRQFGTTGADQGLAVATSSMGVVVSGVVTAALPGEVHGGGADAFVRAFDANGTVFWTTQFGTAAVDQATGVAADDSGVYITGSLDVRLSSTPPDPRRGFLYKLSLAGTPLWERTISDPQLPPTPTGVAVGPRGVYVIMPTRFAAALPSEPGMVLKYDHDGGAVWARSLSAADGGLSPFGVAGDTSGVYVGGQESGVAGPPLSRDAFIARLDDFTPVAIDIKPGTTVNSVNLGSNGTIPVAILSGETFDAATVDPATVTLDNAAVRLRGNGTAMAALADVNNDGRADLVVHVVTQAMAVTGDTEATLQGATFAGEPIRGFDTIRVVP